MVLEGEKKKPAKSGKFQPGVSGNPAGRPVGARNRMTVLCADLLGDDAGLIMQQCIKRAKKGDPVALRLCVERLLPIQASRDRTVELELPAIVAAADLVAAAGAVIDQAAHGTITLSEAREFVALLSAHRALIETTELTVRIEALEKDAGSGSDTSAAAGELVARVRRCVEEAGGGSCGDVARRRAALEAGRRLRERDAE